MNYSFTTTISALDNGPGSSAANTDVLVSLGSLHLCQVVCEEEVADIAGPGACSLDFCDARLFLLKVQETARVCVCVWGGG